MKASQRWMKAGAAIIVTLAVVGTLAAHATEGGGEKSPLVGSWTLTVSMSGKDFDVTVVVNPDLTGTAEAEWSGETVDLENVVSEGSDASFGSPDLFGLVFTGTIDGDTFEGDVTSDYGDGTFTGVRN
jgi:hypothetical protein